MMMITAPVTAGGRMRLTQDGRRRARPGRPGPARRPRPGWRRRRRRSRRRWPARRARRRRRPRWCPGSGYLALHDQQEDDRRDAAHHDREVGVETHDQREDEGRAEHGEHVLRTDPDGPGPGQALVRGHGLTERRGLPVAVQLPPERHDVPPARCGPVSWPRTLSGGLDPTGRGHCDTDHRRYGSTSALNLHTRDVATRFLLPLRYFRGSVAAVSDSVHVSLRSGVYADSVKLMQVSKTVGARDGVVAVLVAMATPLNLDWPPAWASRPRARPSPTSCWSPCGPSTTPSWPPPSPPSRPR